ncbi:MAG: hypothetical protein K2X66_17475, partial [Cyanobacteria bacterium]|nr:hypothetical protein [Cyanobacteriota bacterium]
DKLELIEFTPKKESTTSVNNALNNVKTTGNAPPPPPSGSGDQDINLYRFDYEIKLKGTYPALVNFINQVIQSNNLVVVDKITIQKPDPSKLPPNASAPASPNPQTPSTQDPSSGISADGNTVILEMSLVLTLYFYDPANPTAAPKTS